MRRNAKVPKENRANAAHMREIDASSLISKERERELGEIIQAGYYRLIDFVLSLTLRDSALEKAKRLIEKRRKNLPSEKVFSRLKKTVASLEKKSRGIKNKEEFSGITSVIADVESAINEMVRANIRLVRSIAIGKFSRVDLIEPGNAGLIRAIIRFNPAKGVRFATYAEDWIRQAIIGAIADDDPAYLSRYYRMIKKRINSASRELKLRSDADSTPEELSEATGYKLQIVKKVLSLPDKFISLDCPAKESDQPLGHFIKDTKSPDPFALICDQERRQTIKAVLATLLPREEQILRLRFGFVDGEIHTLENIGLRFKVTRERIRQLEKRALNLLRKGYRRERLRQLIG